MDTKPTRILFTGDSITDVMRTELIRAFEEMAVRIGRTSSPEDRLAMTNEFLGSGYPALVNAQLAFEEPGRYEVLNRGISGNRIVDLDARVKADCINLHPDVLSIMIGINDVWHDVMARNGVDAEKFERVYDNMLAEILRALPNLKLILIEPFVLHGPATEPNWDFFSRETDLRRAAVWRLAAKYGALFVPAQKLFSDAAANTAPVVWSKDGVHPTPAGHWMLALEWLKLFRSL
jgi:lysophospholipase L1-like esterase